MAKIEIVETKQEYVDAMKGKMRAADDYECKAISGNSADTALQWAFENSAEGLNWTALAEDKPILSCGCCATKRDEKVGVVWLLGTEDFVKMKDELKEIHGEYLKKMLEKFEMLETVVSVENLAAMRFIKRCGFKIEEPKPWGINGEMFCYVHLHRGDL